MLNLLSFDCRMTDPPCNNCNRRVRSCGGVRWREKRPGHPCVACVLIVTTRATVPRHDGSTSQLLVEWSTKEMHLSTDLVISALHASQHRAVCALGVVPLQYVPAVWVPT